MKTELGRVYYMTLRLIFPDKDEWVQQTPIPGASEKAMYNYIKDLHIEDRLKTQLMIKMEASWKDHNGIWHQLIIETQRRKRVWGTKQYLAFH